MLLPVYWLIKVDAEAFALRGIFGRQGVIDDILPGDANNSAT